MPRTLSIDPSVTRWNVPLVELPDALATRPLVVAMHGFGADERDLVPLGQFLPPEFVIAAVRAPISLINSGYAWQPIGGQEHPTPELFSEPADAVTDWLEVVAAEYGSVGTSTSLLGFSQGAAMVVQLFRQHPQRFAAGVFLSGFVGGFSWESDAALAARKPALFWGRDVSDPIITEASIDVASRFLPQHFSLTQRTYSGIGHGISRDEVDDIAAFLQASVIDSSAR